jgi:hypothetical protein
VDSFVFRHVDPVGYLLVAERRERDGDWFSFVAEDGIEKQVRVSSDLEALKRLGCSVTVYREGGTPTPF